MMKKLFLLVVCVFFTHTTSASHLLGGMITVAQTSPDSTSIAAYFIMDQQGIIPPKQYVGQYELVNGFYTYTGTVELHSPITSTHQGTYLVQYTSDYLNLDSNKYRFVATHCCWGNINNSTNSLNSNMVISADYWHIPNNSLPYMENPLWVNVQKDTLNTMKPMWGVFNCFLSQFDTDSVSITQSDLYSGYANGTFIPQTHTQIPLYVSNDSISWTPTTLDNFGTGFEIAEYRNGDKIGIQRIQWTFRVLASTIDIEENIVYRDTQYKVYDWCGKYMGTNLENQKGFRILRYENGKIEKIFIQ